MTFGLPSWLKSKYQDLAYDIPIWYPTHDQPDHREWLLTNGLGGYASGTISGANTRRYHGALVAALRQPVDRHVILSKLDEVVTVNGRNFELSTNHWASGVVSPTGYKLLESFTIVPTPTWVYNLDGHYLIKQMALGWGTNRVYASYYWMPEQDAAPLKASIAVRFLAGFRQHHSELRGSANMHYPQDISDQQATIALFGASHRLNLAWNQGRYEIDEHWWWGSFWPEEAARGLSEQEDLFLAGSLTAPLDARQELSICASYNDIVDQPDCQTAVTANLKRQKSLLIQAALPRAQDINLLVLACDQFVVRRSYNGAAGMSIMAGYPWFNDFGRDAMVSLPGLTLSPRRYDEARSLLSTFAGFEKDGLLPCRFYDDSKEPDYLSADTSLWWAWALYQYYLSTKDLEFIKSQFPVLKRIAECYIAGTKYSISMDGNDGLLRCGSANNELSWMDTRVADIPITPRSGKAVEICALWYNLLEVLVEFGSKLGEDVESFAKIAEMSAASMQKFWNNELQCLYDVLEPGNKPHEKPISDVRPNQIFAVSMPFHALTKLQEKAIMTIINDQLLTPFGLRTLSPTNRSYQGRYGCGFTRADQYHRDLSYHQGTIWPWLMGAYCDALININGALPETYSKIRVLLQPLITHFMEDNCAGSISEIFDGSSPHQPHGAIAKAWSVAEVMRMLALTLRQS